jgi:hypothetical protein
MAPIFKEKQQKMISEIEREMIPKYRISDLRESISKCQNQAKDKILFLIDIVEKEINEANGQLTKKINKIKSFGTID